MIFRNTGCNYTAFAVNASHNIKPDPCPRGCLYIVATPIGHPDDITLRALETLKTVDAIICEEFRHGSTALKRIGVNPRQLIELNEHNETERAQELLVRLTQGESMALISDCGTPVFADPGHHLIHLAAQAGVRVAPIPGASSLTAALSVLDFEIRQFVFAGFLPRQPVARRRALRALGTTGLPIVLIDTPYRLQKILAEVCAVFGKNQQLTLVCDISHTSEAIYRGTANAIIDRLSKRKAEFVLIVHSRTPTGREK